MRIYAAQTSQNTGFVRHVCCEDSNLHIDHYHHMTAASSFSSPCTRVLPPVPQLNDPLQGVCDRLAHFRLLA